jgi:hypothetical protein
MRIRQIRPEFFTDPVTAHLTPAAQVTYIGLWCVADDAGWLAWDVPQIGALLSPYKSVRVRERMVERAGEELVKAGRLVIHACGCAHVPKLETHQRIGGNKAYQARDRHRVHTSMDKSARNVTVGNGMERNDAPARGSLKERVGWIAPGKAS